MHNTCLIAGISFIAGLLTAAPRLSVPEISEDHSLPGITGAAETFALNDIDAPALVLLVFDLYCPACQKSASNMKRLAEALGESTPAIPILGVGSGDTVFETRTFQKKFRLPFPCISDRDKTMAGHYEVERTPSVMVLVRQEPQKAFSEVYRHEGYLGREHIQQILSSLEEIP